MNEHSRATAFMSVPVPLALCFGVGCAEGGIERSPGDVPTFHGTVDLEFGEIEGEDPYLFTRIESIVEDTRGRLLVADLQSHEVRVFGSEGDFQFRFGGQGEGPGELTRPCCLAFGPEGRLWVRESTRYSVFRLDGASAEYDGGARIAHVGIGMVAPITFDAEGRLVDIGSLMTEDGGATARLHHGSDGAVDTVIMAGPEKQATGSTTVERMIGDTPVMFFVYQPFGPLWVHAHSPGGTWAEAVTLEYLVTLHHPDGTVSRVEGPQLPGPRLGPSELERAQALLTVTSSGSTSAIILSGYPTANRRSPTSSLIGPVACGSRRRPQKGRRCVKPMSTPGPRWWPGIAGRAASASEMSPGSPNLRCTARQGTPSTYGASRECGSSPVPPTGLTRPARPP